MARIRFSPAGSRSNSFVVYRAIDLGVNFIDTADVYGDGHSERLIAKLRRERQDESIVATKAGRRLGVLARVPLASGLLSGKLRRDSTFSPDDHRAFDRRGEAFDMGETFGGIDFDTGLRAVEELRALVHDRW